MANFEGDYTFFFHVGLLCSKWKVGMAELELYVEEPP